ncbi:hypothetical protein BX616_002260 [Lobosporangium transversale]|uniref:Uncharacterized protein n=1 Tax=Lobosporangium transversale TaxID=64571 RepID=A0A1Y2GCU3_9FUNG|nr:hypothetical protein BCR41DRAFT_361038 [Lobosporangium transversale]KAF9901458.1 hypothetical protein BX616_002260 [Lobosporangium transversale]ORZ06300.1 hypothetical protein BCR41DRAFT_361038 [Lobosporangium transversale]|eukprot:XP_021877463.1 hypothetical protein BCR41DRAFT_361038 [Lobosporangium transversale]
MEPHYLQTRRHPLLLPEILHCLGRFIPLWPFNIDFIDSGQPQIFDAKTLLACLLVCRTWYSALHPFLWHTFDARYEVCPIFSRVLPETLKKNANHIRSFIAGPTFMFTLTDTLHLPKLAELVFDSFSDLRTDRGSYIESSESLMIVRNPHIKKLGWKGPYVDIFKRHPLKIEPLIGLQCLTVLDLMGWDASGGALRHVLCAVANTITWIKLLNVYGVEDRDVMDISLPLVSILEIEILNERSEGVERLPHCCPKLGHLKLWFQLRATRDPGFLSDYFRSIKSPSLASFEMCEPYENGIVEAIQGFEVLKACTFMTTDLNVTITEAILRCHACTLTRLSISLQNTLTFNILNVQKQVEVFTIILERCRGLEELALIAFGVYFTDVMLLEEMFKRPWGCHKLRRFEIDGLRSTLPVEEEGHEIHSSSLLALLPLPVGYGWCIQRCQAVTRAVYKIRNRFLRQLLEYVQEFSDLRTIQLNSITFVRGSMPASNSVAKR